MASAWLFEEAKPEAAAELAWLAGAAGVPGWSEASIASTLRDAGAHAFGARDDAGRFAGFVLSRAVGDEVEILLVVVAPAVRRRGLGRALLRAALAQATMARTAFLEVRVSNSAAIALYEGLGFVAVGRRPRYYDGGEDALSMRLDVRGGTR